MSKEAFTVICFLLIKFRPLFTISIVYKSHYSLQSLLRNFNSKHERFLSKLFNVILLRIMLTPVPNAAELIIIISSELNMVIYIMCFTFIRLIFIFICFLYWTTSAIQLEFHIICHNYTVVVYGFLFRIINLNLQQSNFISKHFLTLPNNHFKKTEMTVL